MVLTLVYKERGGGGVNKSFRKYAKQFCIKTKK